MTKQWSVGDTVYIEQRYPDDPNRPFVARTITGTYEYGGETRYLLNEVVQVGKEYSIGCEPYEATGSDFYWDNIRFEPAEPLWFLALGDTGSRSIIVSPDTVYDDLSD